MYSVPKRQWSLTGILAGIRLTGQLSGWATTKDLILKIAGKLTVRVCSVRLTFLKDDSSSVRVGLVVSWNTSVPACSTNHAPVFLSFTISQNR